MFMASLHSIAIDGSNFSACPFYDRFIFESEDQGLDKAIK